ncbi:MAG: hypothetical protein Q7T71_09630 [Herbiconiux sp.]|nr:hypothetical protein [Herbiconiux sp.]
MSTDRTQGLNAIRVQIEDDLRDAPVMAKIALEKFLSHDHSDSPPVVSAGRVGRRQGDVSELTVMADLKPGGAQHLRTILNLIGGKMSGARAVGSVHDMRFVTFDGDTKILFCTAYDGDWDAYIDDFATKIPELMDLIFANIEGWPGIADPGVKDFIAAHQLTALGWFVDAPHLTVVETRRMQGNQRLLDAFLDDYAQRETKDAAEMTEDELRASHRRLEAFLAQIGSGGVGTV